MSQLELDILNFITSEGFASFAELDQINAEENYESSAASLVSETIPNLYLGFAKTATINAVSSLLRQDKVHLSSVRTWVYYIDGRIPDMPMAIRLPKNGYKKPHWLPLIVKPGPHPDEKRLI